MTPERLRGIEDRFAQFDTDATKPILERFAAAYGDTPVRAMSDDLREVLLALHEAQTQVLELRDSQSARRMEEMREALQMAQAAIGLLGERVNEAEQAGFRRGIGVAAQVAEEWGAFYSAETRKIAAGQIWQGIRALLPPDAPETSENPLP